MRSHPNRQVRQRPERRKIDGLKGGPVGIDDWQSYVKTDSELMRPADSAVMVGNPTRAEEILGWRRTMSFEGIVAAMVNADRTV